MKIEQFDIIEFIYDFREPDYDSFQKDLEVIDIIFDIIKDREVHLFEFSPIKDMSIVEYFSENYKYKKNYKDDYVYTIKSLKLTKEMIAEIVGDSFFQLGRSAIVLSELNEEAVLNLMICWTDERPLAGIEMIRLDYDGECLLFYNMKENKELQKIIANHN